MTFRDILNSVTSRLPLDRVRSAIEDVKEGSVGAAKGIITLLAQTGTSPRVGEFGMTSLAGTQSLRTPPTPNPLPSVLYEALRPSQEASRAQRIGFGIGSLSPGSELLTPYLEKKGVSPALAFGAGLIADIATPGPDILAEEGLTTKVLQRLEGKSRVSRQFIEDLTNMGDIKQAEKNLIRGLLEREGKEVDVPSFADKVKTELLPLNRNAAMGTSRFGDFRPQTRYESVALPDELRGPVANYSEHIYESPIKTSAGDVHFDDAVKGGPPNYFAHSRIEDMAPEYMPEFGKVRRVIEQQSDLFQKGRMESSVREPINRRLAEGEITRATQGTMEKESSGALSRLAPYENNWSPRITREEIKQAAVDGVDNVFYPTGETAMKIEGLGENNQWFIGKNPTLGEMLTADKLKVGQEIGQATNTAEKWVITDVLGDGKFKAVPKNQFTDFEIKKGLAGTLEGHYEMRWLNSQEQFDISGSVDKENPIYKFYEKEVGRYLKNKYGAERIVDPQGVEWFQLKVPKESGRLPVEAFAAAPFLSQRQDKEP